LLASPKTVRTHATRNGLLAIFVLLICISWFGSATPVSAATTAQAMDSQILSLINSERAAAGLVGLRRDTRLAGWAGERSAWMVTHGILTHDSWDGAPCTMYAKMRIAWYGCGEAIGFTTANYGSTAASFLFNLWKASPDHQALLMSSAYNYVGIGVAYRASTHTTYASILFLEGPDRTPPVATLTGPTVSGGRLHWSWTGSDPVLQTHQSGMKNFDVQLSANGGAWKTIQSNSTVTSETTRVERAGSTWRLRVRATDMAGNNSAWVTSSTAVVH
jgi:uncharacterized protein YkwD